MAPDDICRTDADLLVKSRPAVIIDFASYQDLEAGEIAFRGGKPSGQRYLYLRMYQLIQTDYRLEATFNLPEASEPVRVYVRRDEH